MENFKITAVALGPKNLLVRYSVESRRTFVPKLIFYTTLVYTTLFYTNFGSNNKNLMGFKFSDPVFSCFSLLKDLIYAN